MRKAPTNRPPRPATLSLRVGRWFEAEATGWGVVMAPVALLVAAALVVLKLLWG